MTRSVHSMIVGSAMALLAAACVPVAQSTPAPASGAATVAASASAAAQGSGSAQGPVTIKYFSALNEDEPYVRAYKEIIAQFEKEHPGTTVEVNWMGRSMSSKLRPLLQSGTRPDIVEDDLQVMHSGLMGDGLIGDLSAELDGPALTPGGTWRSTWADGSLELLSIAGQNNTLPFWVNAAQVFYDQRVFDKSGLKPPQTWAELQALCTKVATSNQPCFAQDGTNAVNNDQWFSIFSDRLLGCDGWAKAAADRTGQTWLEPGYLEVARKVYSIKSEGLFSKGFEGSQYPAAQVDWVNGSAALLLLQDWVVSELTDAAPADFKFRSFPFPTIDGKGVTTQVEMYQWGFGMFKDAPNRAPAIEFLKFFTSPDSVAKLQDPFGFVTAVKTDTEPLNNGDSQANITAATELCGYLGGLVADDPAYLDKVFQPLGDKLLYNEITPEEFIQQISEATKNFKG